MNKRLAVLFVLILAAVAVWTVLFLYKDEIKQAEAKYADNPVTLYQTAGIKACGYDNRHKGKLSGAVRLKGDDLAKAIAFLEKRYNDITAVLYINAPEASEQSRGQPALLPLRLEDGKYCALGLAGSYSVPLFLELEGKYQGQIQ